MIINSVKIPTGLKNLRDKPGDRGPQVILRNSIFLEWSGKIPEGHFLPSLLTLPCVYQYPEVEKYSTGWKVKELKVLIQIPAQPSPTCELEYLY